MQTGLKKAPPLPAKKEAEKRRKEAPPLRKAAGKKAAPAEKKAKRRSMRERSGLVISPNRCQRMIRNTWQGGKISKVGHDGFLSFQVLKEVG